MHAPAGTTHIMAADSRQKHVLSIQSHVVHGRVGNTAAAFPLQLLGYEVDLINSVQLSNHTGYPTFKGQVLEAAELDVLLSGLRSNSLLSNYTHILTGYIGSCSFLNKVYDFVIGMKGKNPNLIYVCDPVMGDNGQMYVPNDLLPVYREKLIQIADLLTPNCYEAELLTGISIKTENDAQMAIDALLKEGARTVVITSIELNTDDNNLILIAGNREGEKVRLFYPKIRGQFTGTGDLFTALLLGWNEHGLKVSCEKAVMTMQAVLKRTQENALRLSEGKVPSAEHIELQLVRSKGDIESPPPFHSSCNHVT